MSNYRSLPDRMGGQGANDDNVIDVDVSDPDVGGPVEMLPDGGALIHREEKTKKIPTDAPFNANLAEYLDDTVLNEIASTLIDAVNDDILSNQDFKADYERGLTYLGIKIDYDKTMPFKGASGVYDTIMLDALIREHATIFPELFPSQGPAKTEIIGQGNQQLSDQASRVEDYLNYYLTQVLESYYDDSDQMLFHTILSGSTFRKIYKDEITGRPTAKFFTFDNFILPYTATGLSDAERYTQINRMSQRDVKFLQYNGTFIDVELGSPSDYDAESDDVKDRLGGKTYSIPDDDRQYKVYEICCYLDIKGFEHTDGQGDETGIPLPYRVFLEAYSEQILRIERNWDATSSGMFGLHVKQNIVQWKFMSGFGPYGYGLVQLLGNSSKYRTETKRMIHNTALMAGFPAGLKLRGAKSEDNDIGYAPGELRDIDTGGVPIQQSVMPLPFKEPPAVLYQLFSDEGNDARRIASTMDIAAGEGRQDAPVGTTIALLQQANKPLTATMRRFHRALSKELKMFADLLGELLPAQPYPFPVRGGKNAIMKQDFDQRIDIVPVSDPNICSSTERMMRAQTILQVVQQVQPNSPPYILAAVSRLFDEMGIDNYQELLPAPPQQAQPFDPATENMNSMHGMPLQASIEQNHDAHIMAHTPFAQSSPEMQAHIAQHQAFKYQLQIQQYSGIQLPPPGQKLPPQIENQIAAQVAKATQVYQQEQEQKQAALQGPTMQQIAMAEVQADVHKADLRFKTEMAAVQKDVEIQQMRSDDDAAKRAKDLQIAEMHSSLDIVKGAETQKENRKKREMDAAKTAADIHLKKLATEKQDTVPTEKAN